MLTLSRAGSLFTVRAEIPLGMSAAEKSLWFVEGCTQAGQEQASLRRMAENSTIVPSMGILTRDVDAFASVVFFADSEIVLDGKGRHEVRTGVTSNRFDGRSVHLSILLLARILLHGSTPNVFPK
jgi:hypothetical protein